MEGLDIDSFKDGVEKLFSGHGLRVYVGDANHMHTCSVTDIEANCPDLGGVVIGNEEAIDFAKENNTRLLLVSDVSDWERGWGGPSRRTPRSGISIS